jgi:hypothetical protein
MVPLAVIALAFTLIVALPARADVKDADYYPLKVGTTWEYKAMGQTITIKVAKHEKYNGEMCALLETSAMGRVVASEHISVQKDGVFRHSMAGQKADPAVRFLKIPFKDAETWKVESKIGGQNLKVSYTYGKEKVTVPAGKYDAIYTKTSEFEAGGQKVSAQIWYAKGVGMVKTVMKLANFTVTLELSKFTAGK